MNSVSPDEFRADLHCHSSCSDGSLSPQSLIIHAKQIGLSGLSITDHDTIEAYNGLLQIAEMNRIQVISGVEFSCHLGNKSIHILGYSFAINDPIIVDFCKQHAIRRENRNAAILQQLANHGMRITEEEVIACLPKDTSKHSIGRPHIAMALLKRGYITSLQEAFKHYIGEGKPCYVRGDIIKVDETIDIIHAAKGLAIIAHPHLLKNDSDLKRLLKLPFDGIECYYSKFFSSQHEQWVKIATEKQWLITGGSDFHGEIKPDIPLGCSWIGKETFSIMHDLFQKNSR